MRALKKIMAALALTAVLAGCSADNIFFKALMIGPPCPYIIATMAFQKLSL